MHRMAIMRDDLSSGRPVNYRVGLFVWVPRRIVRLTRQLTGRRLIDEGRLFRSALGVAVFALASLFNRDHFCRLGS